ncbi:MAG: 30S ribosomal protein S18 [Chloroflexia bacterium]|nr:30S ribosomal protein S18 [Chloroflexia bacterium]
MSDSQGSRPSEDRGERPQRSRFGGPQGERREGSGPPGERREGGRDGGRDGDRPRGRRPGGGGGRFSPRRKVCQFCVDNVQHVDYKDLGRLRRHIGERGKIEPRRKLGTCAKHQRSLTVAVKRARYIGLLPFTNSGPRS